MNPEISSFVTPEVADLVASDFESLLDLPPSETVSERFASFRLGDRFFSINAEAISEIIQPLPFTPLPNTASFVLGIAEIRGDIVSVIDLENLLFDGTPRQPRWTKMIVLRPEFEESAIVIPVEKLSEMIKFDVSSLHPPDASASPVLSGSVEYNGEVVHLVDCSGLNMAFAKKLADRV